MTADPKPTPADLELLERIEPLLADRLGKLLAPLVRLGVEKLTAATERRLVEVEAQLASLRQELSNRPAPRSFTALGPDPNRAGHTLVRLDDGGVLSARDERLDPLAGDRPAGRA
jgi:hypothetical protein